LDRIFKEAAMLIISRKPSEQVLIGDIRVVIVRSNLGNVRIGIDAPRGIPIVRADADGVIQTIHVPDQSRIDRVSA
jgi:carbon storage regulator CsrA